MTNQSTEVWQLLLQLFINSWCIFKREQHKEFSNILHWFDLRENTTSFLRSRSFEVFKEFIKNWFFALCWNFGNWLHISTSLIWPQPKHSIPVSSYISDLLYRVALVSWFLCKSFNCIQTATEFLNYRGVIWGTVRLYWWFAYCGEQCEAFLGYTVGSV